MEKKKEKLPIFILLGKILLAIWGISRYNGKKERGKCYAGTERERTGLASGCDRRQREQYVPLRLPQCRRDTGIFKP